MGCLCLQVIRSPCGRGSVCSMPVQMSAAFQHSIQQRLDDVLATPEASTIIAEVSPPSVIVILTLTAPQGGSWGGSVPFVFLHYNSFTNLGTGYVPVLHFYKRDETFPTGALWEKKKGRNNSLSRISHPLCPRLCRSPYCYQIPWFFTKNAVDLLVWKHVSSMFDCSILIGFKCSTTNGKALSLRKKQRQDCAMLIYHFAG